MTENINFWQTVCAGEYYDKTVVNIFFSTVTKEASVFAGLVTLCKLKRESPGVISDRASAKLRETIIRLGELF